MDSRYTNIQIIYKLYSIVSLFHSSFVDLIQNTTIEERVTLLEIQVVEIQEDLAEVDEDVTGLDQDVNFLFDEQVIQDARIFTLEQTTVTINAELVAVDDELESEFYKIKQDIIVQFFFNYILCLFLLSPLCRCTSHNNKSGFPSHGFGRGRRGRKEQLCSWTRNEGGDTWRNSCWSRDQDFYSWDWCQWYVKARVFTSM